MTLLKQSLNSAAAAFACALALSVPASAQSLTSGDRTIRARVEPMCDISGGVSEAIAAGRLDFGQHVMLPNARRVVEGSTTSMVVQCNVPNTTATVTFGDGNNPDGASIRRMAGPSGGRVPYYLYRDAAGIIPWGNTPQSIVIPTDQPAVIPIYGRIPPMTAFAPEGEYTDEVQVTIAY